MRYTLLGSTAEIQRHRTTQEKKGGGALMSKIVARMEKMKDGNLSGIQRHNQRETNNHSNPDIDIEKSHLNYDLVNPGSINYREKIKQIIESQRISKRAVRKDAVLVNEWIITSDTAFFQENTDTQAFFTDVVAYFSDRCGRQNVAYATVHLDETTPHMHLGIVPMYEGRLSSKQVFSRQNLLEIQEELPTYLQERGYAIERGLRGSPQKHLSVKEYKDVQKELQVSKQELAKQEQILAEKERELHSYEQAIFRIDRLLEEKNEEVKGKVQAMNQLETKRNEIINSLQTTVLPDLANVKEKKFSLNGLKYVLSASDFSAIKSITKDFETLRTQNKHLKIENNNLAQKNKELTQVNHEQELQITELAYELTLKKEQLTAFEEKQLNYDQSEQIKQELDTTTQTVSVLETENKRLKDKITDLTYDFSELNEKYQEIKLKFDGLTTYLHERLGHAKETILFTIQQGVKYLQNAPKLKKSLERYSKDRTYLIDEKGTLFLPPDTGSKGVTMSLNPHFYPLKAPFYNRETGCYEFVGEYMANGRSRTNTLQLSEEQVLEKKAFTFEQSTDKKAWQQSKKYSRDMSKGRGLSR